MPSSNGPNATPLERGGVTPDSASVEAALQGILGSPEFEGAGRVQSFLDYVVKEKLAGRGDRIRGKTIVEDVYGRSPSAGRDPVAVVRVDAGRLRRRLADYYAGPGKRAALKISFKPGSYEPHFVSSDMSSPGPEKSQPQPQDKGRMPALGMVVAGLVGGLVVLALWLGGVTNWPSNSGNQASSLEQAIDPGDQTARAVRDALFSSSPARLQAANLAAQARDMLFPALEPRWQAAVLRMFEIVIETDPNFFGGYAGAAESKSLMAVMLPAGDGRDTLLNEAEELASRALELGIGESWSHSAAGLVALVKRDFGSARRDSERAISLDPEDLHTLNLDALIALFDGQFERATEAAERAAARLGPDDNFPNKSIRASAQFHLGKFPASLSLFEASILEGDPISPISLGYLIAIHTRMDQPVEATQMLELLDTAWPGFPMDALYRSLYRDPAHADAVMDALKEAGWLGRTQVPTR